MKAAAVAPMKFPCDCLSSIPTCEEPWARVAKEGMFKDGTKEEILNHIHHQAQTIAQLAKSMKLAQPTVFRHISELVSTGLVREFDPEKREYVVERYYAPNFPVVRAKDQSLYKSDVDALAQEIAATIAKRLPRMKSLFIETEASAAGESFEEFAHFLVHRAEREARKVLEKKGALAVAPKEKGLGFIFWATE